MKKIKLEIVGLSYSQTQTGAYALILNEEKGTRRLPIIIGSFEAQSIAIEMEKMTPTRPLTHDLFKSFASAFLINVEEIVIYNLIEGVFYAKIVCSDGRDTKEIDARTSDAIAIAMRFSCPIYTYDFILSTAGVQMDDSDNFEGFGEPAAEKTGSPTKLTENELATTSTEELSELLKKALDDEAYEKASRIRDEINRRKQN
ncbi:MAG: hypothetical protein RIQ89_176 [Bacteroidota bacterium]|jgi:uncharacterized protein